MKKLVFIFVAGIYSVIFLSTAVQAEVIDRTVAVVNDSIITQSDVQDFQKNLKKNGLIDEALLSMYDRDRLAKDYNYLISYLIDEMTIDSDIKAQGIVTPIEQVEGEIRNIAKARGFDRNQLKMALKNEGVAYSDYQDFIKTSLQRQTLLQKEVTAKIKVSDDEVNSYYVNHYSSGGALVFEFTLAHIVFLNSNGGASAAQQRANSVYEKLESKVPFETLASQHSEDPQFTHGGLFGTFRISEFNKEVSSAVSPLNAGEISAPVKMADGYHIFKVLKKDLVPSPELEKRRDDIRRLLTAEEFKKQFHAWLEQKRRDAYIKIN